MLTLLKEEIVSLVGGMLCQWVGSECVSGKHPHINAHHQKISISR